jgi:hypothetical protein
MDYEVLPISAHQPGGVVRKHNLAFVLLYCCCLGLIGFVFAIGRFILFITGLVLDLLAFLGLLGVAFGSLVWGKIKRSENRLAGKISEYFRNPVWK